jgi:hypothetical protein
MWSKTFRILVKNRCQPKYESNSVPRGVNNWDVCRGSLYLDGQGRYDLKPRLLKQFILKELINRRESCFLNQSLSFVSETAGLISNNLLSYFFLICRLKSINCNRNFNSSWTQTSSCFLAVYIICTSLEIETALKYITCLWNIFQGIEDLVT